MNNNFILIQQPSTIPKNSQIEKFADLMKSQSGLVLLGCFASIGILKLISGSNYKGKVATSLLGVVAEKNLKQPEKRRSRYLNRFVILLDYMLELPHTSETALQKQWYKGGFIKTKPTFKQKFLSSNSTLYVPDAQRGIAVIGAAGSGKTFSVIDPVNS